MALRNERRFTNGTGKEIAEAEALQELHGDCRRGQQRDRGRGRGGVRFRHRQRLIPWQHCYARIRADGKDNAMIGGFIVVTQPTRVLVRAIGPSLTQFGVPDALANPQLELHDASSTIGQNDDWRDDTAWRNHYERPSGGDSDQPGSRPRQSSGISHHRHVTARELTRLSCAV